MSSSVAIYFDEPMYSDGLLAQTVDAMAASGAAYFSSAGKRRRWAHFFRLDVLPFSFRTIKSVTFDLSTPGLVTSATPGRFHIGSVKGVNAGDVTFSRTDTTMTLTFKPGTFGPNDSIDFGMSVFDPVEGFTTVDPDRFEGTKVTVTFDNGSTHTGRFAIFPKIPIDFFTGAGLVNANAAAR